MTTVGLPVALGSDINVTRSLATGESSILGCNAYHENRSQRANYTKKRRRSSSTSGSASFLSITQNFTNSLQLGKSTNNMKSLKQTGVKQENLKHAHSEVQDTFAKNLAEALKNPNGVQLQCCITYTKPCGCIRKYILGGDKWKEDSSIQLRNADDIDVALVSTRDKSMLGNLQLRRAAELVAVYEHAAELKKEKCYAFNNVEVEGKTLKELRGMIGLGNGRKRSKKYEDYVLQMRSTLRNQYSLCEKAAQKLLGYSINFLYKKLRTNPQKTSRLVATNKAERASKAPRHLIPLEELREMGRKANGSNQCCGRNCISRLASQHFDKIEDWRKRLEGSGQKVAQQIVAEVLRASSSSFDGQNSFCQNLVHWVTGCSFKKIRRVRDHLKKDPQTLPEHGLKKYWKDKVKNKQKNEPPQKIPKIEKQEYTDEMYGYYGHEVQMNPQNYSFPPHQYNGDANGMYSGVTNGTSGNRHGHYAQHDTTEAATSTQWTGTNINNSNNMMAARGYGVGMNENKPIFGVLMSGGYPSHLHNTDKNRGTPDPSQMASNSCQYQAIDHNRTIPGHIQSSTYSTQDDLAQRQQFNLQSRKLGPQSRTMTASPYHAEVGANVQHGHHFDQQSQYLNNQSLKRNDVPPPHIGQGASRSSVILHTAGSQHQQAPAQEPPPYDQPMTTGHGVVEGRMEAYDGTQLDHVNQNDVVGMAFNPSQLYGQHYYIAAAPPNNGYDSSGFLHSGMTPFILPQHNEDSENQDENKNSDQFGYPRQPFYIFSPVPSDKGLTSSDWQNFKQLTPIQILQTPYLHSGRGQDQNGENGNNGQESQRFLFPMPFSNTENATSQHGKGDEGKNFNQDASLHLPSATALTPLAVVHNPGGGIFNLGPWQVPNQADTVEGSARQQNDNRTGVPGQQWPLLAFQQYPPNVNLEQLQGQAHIMYDTAQLHPHSSSQYAIAAMQPAGFEKQQGSNDAWQQNDKKIAETAVTDNKSMHVVSSGVSTFQPTQIQTGGNEVSHTDKMDEENLDEKEEDGIVTPKIIREALSNKFGPRAATTDPTPPEVPALGPISNNNNKPEPAEPKPLPPKLEMPKLAPIPLKTKSGEDDSKTEGEDEERCAAISTRAKRFSRDRLRATIDSPNIILTPFTPLTPNLTPVIVIPDTSEDDTGKDDTNTSASSTNSKHMDGSIFLFPPTHVSRRKAAIRIQGPTISESKRFKTKNPKDSPKTPGPFPVADGDRLSKSSDQIQKNNPESEKEVQKSQSNEESPTLTLRSLNQSGESDKSSKDKIPVLGFDAAHWHDEPSTLMSPGMEVSEEGELNTPTQQPLNTPTSQLNTPTQQLNTPNQDLKTPTESPVKSMQQTSTKRKLDTSVNASEDSSVTEDSASSTSSVSKSSTSSGAPSAKGLKFHCFTPSDFRETINSSAFRKPSEFASTPTESTIAQRRRRPRKQLNPVSVTSPEDENSGDIVMEEVLSPDDVQEESTEEKSEDVITLDDDSDKKTSSSEQKQPQMPPLVIKSGIGRKPDNNFMILGNPFDQQTPSLLQLITPSMLPSNNQEPSARQHTPFSSQQINTPVFLHSSTFLTPNGSGMIRRVSPGPSHGISAGHFPNAPQIFTFMPSGLVTPRKSNANAQYVKSPEKEDKANKSQDDKTKDNESPQKESPEKENRESTGQKVKKSPMSLVLKDTSVPQSPALHGKDSGLQTPSNLKVVTPSMALNGASENAQVFNFPSGGLYQMPHSAGRPPPRGSYVLCTPSKASPSGSKILYQPCTSPSTANGPMALVPVEMLSTPPKKRPGKDATTKKSPEKQQSENEKEGTVPVIVVEPPLSDTNKNSAAKSPKKDVTKDTENVSSTDADKPSTSTETSTGSPNKTATSPKIRNKSTGSPKDVPKPLIMSHVNAENPNVQTPTLLQLVSPTQHSPNSPLVLYPMLRPPFGMSQHGAKLHSPLSAGSMAGTPVMVMQRFSGPGNSSSLLKSALMKNMQVFQFPPPASSGTNAGAPQSLPEEATKPTDKSAATTSYEDVNAKSSEPMDTSEMTPSAAVSVICGPRASTSRLSEKLSGLNDPCLSEAAQE